MLTDAITKITFVFLTFEVGRALRTMVCVACLLRCSPWETQCVRPLKIKFPEQYHVHGWTHTEKKKNPLKKSRLT